MRFASLIIDPGGHARGPVPFGGGLEAALKLAWAMREHDSLWVKYDRGWWSLLLCRQDLGRGAALQLGPSLCAATMDRHAARATLIEAAWMELAREGWSLRLARVEH